MPTTFPTDLQELEAAFRRATSRRIITASEALEHLKRNGWDDLWIAFRACECGNWYSFKYALKGVPGHQKYLRAILSLPSRPST